MADKSYRNIIESIRAWPLSRKLALGGAALLSAALFAFIILSASRVDYKPLYRDLPEQEAASVTQWLRENGVSYELKNNGRSIYVPAGKVYETRLQLAGAGLPSRGGVGFEIFDKQNFGVTKFTQKINYQRALQGELARTIASLDAVKSARVHLVMPEKRLLEEQQQPAKASVVLDLGPGRGLDAGQIQGIVHLVAGSIEGLDKNMVTLVDGRGNTLNQTGSSDPGMAMLPEQLKFKSSLESRLEKRAQALLDRALGSGNAVVKISADLDFTRQSVKSEKYDPDSLVPRSEKVTESSSGYRKSGGIPGVESNLGDSEEGTTEQIPSTRSSEVVNYEISKTVSRTESPVGKVEKINAAVLVEDPFDPSADGGKGAHVPMAEKKLESIRKMVSTAVGIDKNRGDRIEVVSMPFKQEMMGAAGTSESEPSFYDYLPYAKYPVLAILAFIIYLALIRPIVKTLSAEYLPAERRESEIEGTPEQEPKKALDSPERLKQELDSFSVTPAQVVKTWLKEG